MIIFLFLVEVSKNRSLFYILLEINSVFGFFCHVFLNDCVKSTSNKLSALYEKIAEKYYRKSGQNKC